MTAAAKRWFNLFEEDEDELLHVFPPIGAIMGEGYPTIKSCYDLVKTGVALLSF